MKKQMEQEVKVSQKVIDKVLLNTELSKSKKMVELFEMGLGVKDISEIMTAFEGKLVRYNFVYNVVSNYANMNGVKLEKTVKEGKKEQILELYKQGKSNKEISIILKTNYNYVFNTIKTFKLENPEFVPEQAAE